MIKPLKNRVLLKAKQSEEKTKSGIIITNNVKEKSKIAEVRARGEKVNKEYEMLKEWQIVLYNKYSANEIIYKDDEYLIIEDTEILAIIE